MKIHRGRFLSGFLLLLLAVTSQAIRADVRFSLDIAPILLKRCTGCHGERTNQGGYRAHTYANLFRVGASGSAPVVAGKPAASRLFQLITARTEALRMPKSDDPLSPDQIEKIRLWILEGAKFDGSDPNVPLKNLLGPRQHPAAPDAYRVSVPVTALAFAPGGKELAVSGYNEVTLWDAATGTLKRRWQHLPQRIQALSFSPDGKRLLVGGGTPGDYGEVSLVDTSSGQVTAVLDTFNDIVLAAVFNSDGRRIAVGCADGSVGVYDDTGVKRLWQNRVHSDWVTSVSFSADGKFVASGSKDMTVKVFDADNGSLFTTYTGHNRQIGPYRGASPVYAVRFAPDTLLACSAGGGKWIQLWDPIKAKAETGDAGDMEDRFAKQGHAQYIAHGFDHEVYALAVRKEQVFAASGDGLVRQFDLKSFQVVRTYTGLSDWAFALDVDENAHRVVAGSFRGEVRIWDTQTGQCLSAFNARPISSRNQSLTTK